VDEEEISQIYVKLGNDFNVAVAAFARENINMKCATTTLYTSSRAPD